MHSPYAMLTMNSTSAGIYHSDIYQADGLLFKEGALNENRRYRCNRNHRSESHRRAAPRHEVIAVGHSRGDIQVDLAAVDTMRRMKRDATYPVKKSHI